MYMLVKLTQINEFTYDSSSLPLLNSVIYQRLLSIFSSIELVAYSEFFLKGKILIAFNAEESTWPFERLEHYLEREIQGMLKSLK